MTPVERNLSKRLDLVMVRGKRGTLVPVIIPPECSRVLDMLVAKRSEVGVPDTNPFVFARVTMNTYLDAGQCLKSVIKEKCSL